MAAPAAAPAVVDKFKLYHATLEGLKSGPAANRNLYIKTLSECLYNNSCPMAFRILVEAQHSYNGVKLNQPDGQSIRIKAFNAATVGTVLTSATHVLRAGIRSAALPLSLLQSWGKAGRYNLTGEVKEEFRRTGHEWVDLGVSLLCLPLGLCKTVSPDAFEKKVDWLTDVYVQRIDARTTRNKYVADKVEKYAADQARILAAWAKSEKPPVIA